jgi:hypothetical protein
MAPLSPGRHRVITFEAALSPTVSASGSSCGRLRAGREAFGVRAVHRRFARALATVGSCWCQNEIQRSNACHSNVTLMYGVRVAVWLDGIRGGGREIDTRAGRFCETDRPAAPHPHRTGPIYAESMTGRRWRVQIRIVNSSGRFRNLTGRRSSPRIGHLGRVGCRAGREAFGVRAVHRRFGSRPCGLSSQTSRSLSPAWARAVAHRGSVAPQNRPPASFGL